MELHPVFHIGARACAGEEGEDVDLEAPKVYEAIADFQQLSDRLQQYQAQYNEAIRGAKMDLVFFKVRHRYS